MMNLTPDEHQWLYTLQRAWPLTERPLQALAESLNTTEGALCGFLLRLREAGVVRRIGGVFDARRLGYQSCLFAIKAEGEALEQAAAEVAALPGVTHVYTRGWPKGLNLHGITEDDFKAYPNLWYTLSALHTEFDSLAATLAHWKPQAFPATTRFKIDVVFDTRTQQRDERTEHRSPTEVIPAAIPSLEDQALVRRYQEDTLTPEQPFLTEDLSRLQAWQANGTMRRFGLLLRHRATGFSANAMCCWSVDEAALLDAGRRLAQSPHVTHCYARPMATNFPFNLYAMIHKQSWEEAYVTFEQLTQAAHLPVGGKLFFSTHEYKKSSLRCFV
jgi:DNA-binding Lrp family transcriptional regulator